MNSAKISLMGLALTGCAWISGDKLGIRMDGDGDGYLSEQFGGEDCDDANAAVYPGGADMPYDGEDGNCDGLSDYDQDLDGADAYQYGGTDCDDADPDILTEVFWYPDIDKDGYGDRQAEVQQCEGPLNYIRNGDDCDDSSALIRPGATEVCDGVDNNCDGSADGPESADAKEYYQDSDEDGYGDPETSVLGCSLPEGYEDNDRDCDDSDDQVNPEATEICNDLVDNNCDGGPDNCELVGFGYAHPYSNIPSKAHGRITHAEIDDVSRADGEFGWWAGGIGDVDNDGLDDIMVTAPRDETVGGLDGRLYFFRGQNIADGGLELEGEELWTADARTAVYDGTVENALLGGSALPLGDINGDGFDDFMVDNCGLGSGYGTPSGVPSHVRIFLGASDFWASAPEVWDVLGLDGTRGGKFTDAFGCSLAIGDINGDGEKDLILGATGERADPDDGSFAKSSQGVVYINYGPITGGFDVQTDGVRLTSESSEWTSDLVGRNLASGGDLDGDGLDELTVTTLAGDEDVGYGGGAVRLLYGQEGTLEADPPDCETLSLDCFDAALTGDSSYGAAGEAVAMGDMNADGYDDLVISSPRQGERRGMVYVMFGSTSRYKGEWSLWKAHVRLRGNREGDGLGQTLDVIPPFEGGDSHHGLNGDAAADLWIGAAGQNPSETVYLVYGPLMSMSDTIGTQAAVMIHLSDRQRSVIPMMSALGGRVFVRGAGDYNGDKYLDLVAGFPWHNELDGGTTQDGVVAIFLGGGI